MNLNKHEIISNLILHIENKNLLNSNTLELAKELSKIERNIAINNPLHSVISKKLTSELGYRHTTKKKENSNPNKKKLNFSSRIVVDELNKIVNLSIWKNIPNTSKLFAQYETKKLNLAKNQMKSEITKKKVNTYVNYNNNRKNNIEEDDKDDGVVYNNYMSNSFYLKRKNK